MINFICNFTRIYAVCTANQIRLIRNCRAHFIEDTFIGERGQSIDTHAIRFSINRHNDASILHISKVLEQAIAPRVAIAEICHALRRIEHRLHKPALRNRIPGAQNIIRRTGFPIQRAHHSKSIKIAAIAIRVAKGLERPLTIGKSIVRTNQFARKLLKRRRSFINDDQVIQSRRMNARGCNHSACAQQIKKTPIERRRTKQMIEIHCCGETI